MKWKKKCFKLCGCGSNGKCHYCDSSDFIGYIDGNNQVQANDGPFETNGIPCSSDTIVSLILIILGNPNWNFETKNSNETQRTFFTKLSKILF